MIEDSSWHLDRKVPIGLVIGLLLNACCGIWYASKLDSRVSILEQRAAVMDSDMTRLRDGIEGSRDRLIHVEDRVENILEEIKKLQSTGTLKKLSSE